MTKEKLEARAKMLAKKERKEAHRAERNTIGDAAVQQKKFMEQVEKFSVNRKSRRQFKKAFGVMLPPVNFPYRKDGAVANEEAVDKSIVS